MTIFGHDVGTLEPWIHQYGVAAVFLIIALESFGVPLPGESLLVTAAILAGRGDISFYGLFLSAWAGSVVGDNIGYLIGKSLGHKLLWRYGAKVGLNAARLDKVEATFARFGPVTVCFARFVNVLRQLNGIVAGALKMKWWEFLLFNTIGGALWVLAWTLAGLYIGLNGPEFSGLLNRPILLGSLLLLVPVLIVPAYWFGRRLLAKR